MNTPSTYPVCRHELRGQESKCNGGGYDGCACGRYTKADKEKLRKRGALS